MRRALDARPMGFAMLVAFVFLSAAIPTPGQGAGEKSVGFIWTHQFGASGYDEAYAIGGDATGIYVAGSINGTLPGQSGEGGDDAFMRKYDADGGEMWTRQFGTPGFDEALALTADGSRVFVAGDTGGTLPGQTSAGGLDAYVAQYDLDGAATWTRQFGTSADDIVFAVAADGSGVFVAGITLGTLLGQASAGGRDAFLRKYDTQGNELWTRQFGSVASDEAYALTVDSSGVYVAGTTEGLLAGPMNAGLGDAFVRLYDSVGTLVRTDQFGTSAHDEALALAADASGVYVAGYAGDALPGQVGAGGNDPFVRRYDAEGMEVWTRQFGTPQGDVALGVAARATGVYVAGYTGGAFPGQTDLGNEDVFIRSYDPLGAEVWTRQFGTAEGDLAYAVAADALGLYVAGYTIGALAGETSAGGADAYLARAAESPEAPEDLRTISGDGTVDLTWNASPFDGGSPVTNYRIYRGTTPGSLAILADVGTALTYTDAGVANGVTYYYAVGAANAIGEGPPSSEASANPGQPDATRPDVAITSPLGGATLPSATVIVTGTASDDTAVEKVEVSADGATWVLASGTTSWSTLLTLREGLNTITARATDSSGNLAVANVSVIVEVPASPPPVAPFPLLLGFLMGVGVLVATIVTSVYLWNRRNRKRTEPPEGALPK